MNNQDLDNQQTEENVPHRRRFLQKVGIVAPVVLTFTSPTAFGGTAICMSAQLSGTVSHAVAANCNLGTYTNNSGSINYIRFGGSFHGDVGGIYSGSSNFLTVFGGSGSNATFDSIVTSNPASSESAFITALINAQPPNNYVLTPTQVIALYNNPSNRPAGYASAAAFLVSTFAP